MKRNLFVLAILVVTSALAFGQTDSPKATQNSNDQTAKQRTHTQITGCLTSSKHGEYQLRDQKGVRNLILTTRVDLDSYVGQSVTLVGDQSAKPSTDTGTGRPMPHFKVLEVHPASGNCK